MNYAVIKTGGKQYRVSKGDVIEVDRLPEENGAVKFDKVLLQVSDAEVVIGKPYVEGSVVTGKILEHFKDEKVRVARFKAKSRYRQVFGHRSSLSKVQIENIGSVKSSKSATK